MRKLYEFYEDCGRMGQLDGLFISDDKTMENMKGKSIWFHEVLGKHSEIEVVIGDDNIKVKSEDQDFIGKLWDLFQGDTICGINPLDYYYGEEDE